MGGELSAAGRRTQFCACARLCLEEIPRHVEDHRHFGWQSRRDIEDCRGHCASARSSSDAFQGRPSGLVGTQWVLHRRLTDPSRAVPETNLATDATVNQGLRRGCRQLRGRARTPPRCPFSRSPSLRRCRTRRHQRLEVAADGGSYPIALYRNSLALDPVLSGSHDPDCSRRERQWRQHQPITHS